LNINQKIKTKKKKKLNGERKNKPDEDQSRSSCVVVVDLDDGAVLTWMMKIRAAERWMNGMEKRDERLEKREESDWRREKSGCVFPFCTMEWSRKIGFGK
jgi:hypothetical protein